MSHARDIAIELWGEPEARPLTTAEVYQRLARGVVRSMAEVRASTIGYTGTISPPEDSIYLNNIVNRVAHYGREAIDSAAYALAYEAQLQDASAANEADRYKMLDKLTAYYQILGSD